MPNTRASAFASYKASSSCYLTFLQFLQLLIHTLATCLNAQSYLVLIDPRHYLFGLRNDLMRTPREACPAVRRIPKEVWLEIQYRSKMVASEDAWGE